MSKKAKPKTRTTSTVKFEFDGDCTFADYATAMLLYGKLLKQFQTATVEDVDIFSLGHTEPRIVARVDSSDPDLADIDVETISRITGLMFGMCLYTEGTAKEIHHTLDGNLLGAVNVIQHSDTAWELVLLETPNSTLYLWMKSGLQFSQWARLELCRMAEAVQHAEMD